MNWKILKERFPLSSKEIKEHLEKTCIKDSRILIEDFLKTKGYKVKIGFINHLKNYEYSKSKTKSQP